MKRHIGTQDQTRALIAMRNLSDVRDNVAGRSVGVCESETFHNQIHHQR